MPPAFYFPGRGTQLWTALTFRNEDLAATVRQIYSAPGRDEFILYVKADRNLKYDKVLEAVDIAAKNGVRMAAMITEQQKGTESIVEPPGGGQ